ncbi:glycine zipper 2TM domain-containing protein [Limnohabitans sp. Rim8]|uniref:glycine zipper 2TM domain-containing protein n=1 Tax=Limnohabitans sp. Rim8 TaxID=1100718 RepID=UPI00261001F0|nr:glycine zipper 2TM domain-containing protein [Limnohabitans sp. Rim8]
MKKIVTTLACMAFSALCSAQTPLPGSVTAAPLQAPVPTASGPELVGQVISRIALYQQVAVPGQVCANTPVTVQPPNSGAGAMVGAIAGAALGSQIGGGQGQALATIAGMIGGAMLGDNIEKQAPAQTINQTTCTLQSAYENRLIGYQVAYEYAGKQYTVQLPQDPGPTIALQITPAGLPAAPVAQVAQATGLPTGMVQPQVIYTQPSVVYSSPFYHNPYPFSTSINLGWGFRGGHGRRWR